jgi:hypothetical protein
MITPRGAVCLLGSVSLGVSLARVGFNLSIVSTPGATEDIRTPSLAPGAPTSPERTALVDAFRKQSEGLQKKFEARIHKSDFTMPYRLFRPEAAGKLPLVVYLHGSGGAGNDTRSSLVLETFSVHVSGCCPRTRNGFPATLSRRKPQLDWSDKMNRKSMGGPNLFPAWATVRVWRLRSSIAVSRVSHR